MWVAKTWWVRIVYLLLLLFVEWNQAPGDQRKSGDCPDLDLRGEQWCWANSLLGSVKCSTGSFDSKENGEECGEITECSPEPVVLQMPGSIAQECAGASVAMAGVSTQEWGSLCLRLMNLDILRGWVPKTLSSPEWAERGAVSRPWE